MKQLFKAAPLALGVAGLAFLCWTFGFADLAAAFDRLSPKHLFAYAAFGSAACVGYSLRWRAIARRLGTNPSLLRLIGARLAGDAVGTLLPTGRVGGDPVRIALVHVDGGGVRAGAAVAIDRLVELISNMLVAITAVTIFSLTHGLNVSPRAEGALAAVLILLLASLIVPIAMLRRGVRPLAPLYAIAHRYGSVRLNQWLQPLGRTEDQLMTFFRDHPRTGIYALLGSLTIELLLVFEYHFLLVAFGLHIDVPTLLGVMVASGLVRVAPAPGGIGVLEAGQVAVLTLASGRPDVGFVIGIVLRLHETLWTALGLLALSVQGFSFTRWRLAATAGKAV